MGNNELCECSGKTVANAGSRAEIYTKTWLGVLGATQKHAEEVACSGGARHAGPNYRAAGTSCGDDRTATHHYMSLGHLHK